MTGAVYFIRPVGMKGPIKIGCSVSPDGRRRTLENWSPYRLELIASIKGDYRLERRFHALFADQHERHEWFAWSRRLESVIAQIQAGSFDVESLPEPLRLVGDREALSRAQKATWTPERRLRASYETRVRNTQRRTLTIAPAYASRVADPDVRAQLDAYLADPHTHGETLDEYEARVGVKPYWARERTPATPDQARAA